MSLSDSSDSSFFLASSFFSAGADSVTATVTGARNVTLKLEPHLRK
jgi:hypothetical protein